jgi:hypothetical protein
MLGTMGSALRRAASVAPGKDVLALEQCSRCLQVHSADFFLARAFDTRGWHQRVFSSETVGLGNDREAKQETKLAGTVDPNIVSVSLLVDTLVLMKKLEVQSLRSSEAKECDSGFSSPLRRGI